MKTKINKKFLVSVVSIFALGLFSLGYNVKDLKAETIRVVQSPAGVSTADPSRQVQRDPFFKRGNNWYSVDPFLELSRIQRQMDRLYRDSLNHNTVQNAYSKERTFGLSSDITEGKDKYEVKMDIPGMEKNKINVEVKNDQLLVYGERKNDNVEENANYYARQRNFGSFSEQLSLPGDANISSISADYKQGVLTIDIPKFAKTITKGEKPMKIKVN